MLVGLHNHTCFSDGRYSPATLLERAGALGYERFAITDHNSLSGWQSLPVRPDWLVPGIELSAIADGDIEVHLLGLWVEPRGPLAEHARFFQDAYDVLWRDGIFDITRDEELTALAFEPTTRHRVIEHLGATGNTQQALRGWATAHGSAYLGKLRPRIPHWRDAVEWLRLAGATVGIAHPGRYPTLADMDELIEAVDAIEVVHPEHSPGAREYWRALAVEHGKASWGSHDFHGWSGPQVGGLPAPIALDDAWLSPARPNG